MRIAVDAQTMKQIERETIEEIGVPALVLMERAALAIAKEVKKQAASTQDGLPVSVKIAAVCGSGNNGGDGAAAARLLFLDGYDAAVLLPFLPEGLLLPEQLSALPVTEELKAQLQIALRAGVPVYGGGKTKEYPLLIDALFGIGLKREITGAYAELIAQINKETHWVLAADIPSGISAADGSVLGAAVRADKTVTFGFMKSGLLLYPGAEYAGEICLENAGILRGSTPANICYYKAEDIKALLPVRPAYSHKGTFGTVAVMAGSENMSGAAYFSACAAYRTGAGLVRLLTADCNREILQRELPEAVLSTYGEAQEEQALETLADETVKGAGVLVAGPGISVRKNAAKLLYLLLARCKERDIPCVIDADALNILAGCLEEETAEKAGAAKTVEKGGMAEGGAAFSAAKAAVRERMGRLASYLPERAVITPHLGELSRLTALSAKQIAESLLDAAADCTYNNGITVVIKDARTIVANGTRRYINVSGNQGMATAGSGDVLAGMIAALMAAGKEPYEAACLGCFLHGMAGDLAAKKTGHAPLMAGDLLAAVPELFRQAEGRV